MFNEPITIADGLMAGGAICLVFVILNPRLLKSPLWRATVTPLASIIGSGFLVSGPILDHAAGVYAWIAMAGLCLIAYLFGGAIRHNIAHVQPNLGQLTSGPIFWMERGSNLSLAIAYFVSVAYYLNLFAAFFLRLFDITDPLLIQIGATGVIAAIGVVGALGGLRALERIEIFAVGFKLCLIGGLLIALTQFNAAAIISDDWAWRAPETTHGWEEARILLGLIILVQGFETSRYLGSEYDTETRVKTMRWSQWLASAIYVVFILLITVLFRNGLPAEGGETAIIDMLQPVGAIMAPAIVLTALSSQLSAAVADTNGAGGLLSEAFKTKVDVRIGNVVTALAAAAIIWLFDIYEIIAYASKVFVAYYALQCATAALDAWRQNKRIHSAAYAAGIIICLIVIVFAIPAEA